MHFSFLLQVHHQLMITTLTVLSISHWTMTSPPSYVSSLREKARSLLHSFRSVSASDSSAWVIESPGNTASQQALLPSEHLTYFLIVPLDCLIVYLLLLTLGICRHHSFQPTYILGKNTNLIDHNPLSLNWKMS